MIDRVIKINGSTIQAGAKLLEMQRLMVGMPQSITEHRTPDAPPKDDASPTDEARQELLDRIARTRRKAERESEDEPTPETQGIDVESTPVTEE